MFPFSFESIDWPRPFFASLRAAAEAMRVAGGGFTGLNQCSAQRGLRTHSGMALAFVDQSELPEGVAYEACIAQTGCVPTRANLHDFFNALVWLSFPRIKMQLNAMQAAQIAHDGVGQSRGATRDAVTIFDENAAILVLRDGAQGRDLADALRNHQWHKLFVDRRDCFVAGEGQDALAEVSLFGHALMEKLCAPYKGITAHTWIVFAPDGAAAARVTRIT